MSDNTQREPTEIGTTQTITGTAIAQSQLHTGSDDSTGNRQLLRTEKIRVPGEDRTEHVPFFAGNSVRGHLRRLLAEDLVDRLDYTVTDERLFHLLRSGGVLEKGGKAEIDVGLRRDIRDSFPILDLLGGATGNQMFGGCVDVHHMTLVCAENNWRTDATSETSWHEFVDELFQTRMGETADNTGLDTDFGFDRDDDSDSEDNVGSQQMIYHFDTLVPGTRFELSFQLESYASELARSCLIHGLRLWQTEGTIGGMSASGLGQIDLEFDVDLSDGDQYTAYVDEHSDEIVEALDTLATK